MGFTREDKAEDKLKGLETVETDDKANADSSSETKDKPSQEGKNTPDEDVPFHQHPRWKEREKDWNNRLKEQEQKFQDKIDDIQKTSVPEETTVPEWFSKLYGDDIDVYTGYQKAHQQEKEELKTELREEMNKTSKSEKEEVKKVEDWIDSEITSIGEDNEIDLEKKDGKNSLRNEFVAFMQDHKIFNEDGNLDFRSGWEFFQKGKDTTKKGKDDARKIIADNAGTDNTREQNTSEIPSWQDVRRQGW